VLFMATPDLGFVSELIEVVSRETAVEADDKTWAEAALPSSRSAIMLAAFNVLTPVIRRVVPWINLSLLGKLVGKQALRLAKAWGAQASKKSQKDNTSLKSDSQSQDWLNIW